MSTSVSTIKNIDISGSPKFFQRTTGIVQRLEQRGFPVRIIPFDSHSSTNGQTQIGFLEVVEDEGVIEIEFQEPINGIKGGLFCLTNGAGPVFQRFSLSERFEGPRTTGLTLSIDLPRFEETLTKELTELIGQF